ncbi:MAG: hypothetical protein AAF368_05175 [Planctomycetota bacterium]
MSGCTRFAGLDVHANSILIAVAEEGREEAQYPTQIPKTRRGY